MIEIIKSGSKIEFTSRFAKAVVLSLILVIGAFSFMLTKGLNYGVDFRGGAEIQAKFNSAINLSQFRKALDQNGFKGAVVQSIGEASNFEYLLKVRSDEAKLNQVTAGITKMLEKDYKDKGATIRKTDIVGPKAGEALRNSSFQAMFWALLAIMIYIGLRFDFKYSPGAIVALFHDVVIILGVFAITGREFTLQIVAALLAVIGYSVNDTVIVYDRVREHEQKYVGRSLPEHINNAINETLSRTVLTSGTTLFVSLSMLTLGGPVIHDFFFAITLGVVIGTYSSIFVAAPVTMFFDRLMVSKQQKPA